MTNYATHIHHLQWFDAHYLTVALCKIAASTLKDFLSKGKKSAKKHKLCIIMLINPSLYDFLEKNIFDLQIAIDRIHPVQILSCLDYCIPTDMMWKTTRKRKNDSLENRGPFPTIRQDPDFSWTSVFPKVLDNV